MYTAGIAIYYNFRDKKIQQSLNIIVLLLCVLLFVFVPFNGDQINIVTGNGRIIFSIISICLVFSVYKLEISLPKIIEYPLEKLGIATYSVYLLHPIVYWYTTIAFHRILKIDHPRFLFISIIAITITLSIISYKYLEKPFIDIGKRLTKSKTNLISNGVELNASLYNSRSRSKS
jgi:peptidoglycan/LPS O-acetylase OafA/YrhL